MHHYKKSRISQCNKRHRQKERQMEGILQPQMEEQIGISSTNIGMVIINPTCEMTNPLRTKQAIN